MDITQNVLLNSMGPAAKNNDEVLSLESAVAKFPQFQLAGLKDSFELSKYYNSFDRAHLANLELVREKDFFSYLRQTYDEHQVIFRKNNTEDLVYLASICFWKAGHLGEKFALLRDLRVGNDLKTFFYWKNLYSYLLGDQDNILEFHKTKAFLTFVLKSNDKSQKTFERLAKKDVHYHKMCDVYKYSLNPFSFKINGKLELRKATAEDHKNICDFIHENKNDFDVHRELEIEEIIGEKKTIRGQDLDAFFLVYKNNVLIQVLNLKRDKGRLRDDIGPVSQLNFLKNSIHFDETEIKQMIKGVFSHSEVTNLSFCLHRQLSDLEYYKMDQYQMFQVHHSPEPTLSPGEYNFDSSII